MRVAWLVSLALIIAVAAHAEKKYEVAIKQFTLKNGLRVVLSQDRSAPAVGVCVMYDVGSRNEVKGRTGFAHLFEHMMFQGSENVGKAQHMAIIESVGGSVNGSTNTESTQYYQSVPSNNLETVLWLESDRMRSLVVNVENLKNQQEVVKEEKRMRYDNQPYASARQRLVEFAYTNFNNQHPTIGSMEDLDAALLEDVQSFFNTYYTPNNAALVVAGDLNIPETTRLIRRYFETIPKGPVPPPISVSESPQTEEKREKYDDPLARALAVAIAWHIPERLTADNNAMQWVESVLLSGTASRAYQRLVKQDQVALSINGGADARRGPGLFSVFAVQKAGVSAAEVEESLYDEIRKLQTDLISEEEYQRIKVRIKSARAFQMVQSPTSRAQELARYTIYDGDPHLINTADERMLAITREQIRDAAREYLTPANRTVIEIVPIDLDATGGM